MCALFKKPHMTLIYLAGFFYLLIVTMSSKLGWVLTTEVTMTLKQKIYMYISMPLGCLKTYLGYTSLNWAKTNLKIWFTKVVLLWLCHCLARCIRRCTWYFYLNVFLLKTQTCSGGRSPSERTAGARRGRRHQLFFSFPYAKLWSESQKTIYRAKCYPTPEKKVLT